MFKGCRVEGHQQPSKNDNTVVMAVLLPSQPIRCFDDDMIRNCKRAWWRLMRMIGDQKNCLNFVAISKQPKRFDIFFSCPFISIRRLVAPPTCRRSNGERRLKVWRKIRIKGEKCMRLWIVAAWKFARTFRLRGIISTALTKTHFYMFRGRTFLLLDTRHRLNVRQVLHVLKKCQCANI